jgi:hypothetical protein
VASSDKGGTDIGQPASALEYQGRNGSIQLVSLVAGGEQWPSWPWEKLLLHLDPAKLRHH